MPGVGFALEMGYGNNSLFPSPEPVGLINHNSTVVIRLHERVKERERLVRERCEARAVNVMVW